MDRDAAVLQEAAVVRMEPHLAAAEEDGSFQASVQYTLLLETGQKKVIPDSEDMRSSAGRCSKSSGMTKRW